MALTIEAANLSAPSFERALTAARASARRGLPRRVPRALAACKAAFVRSLMSLRSRSASAAHRCRVKLLASSVCEVRGKRLNHRGNLLMNPSNFMVRLYSAVTFGVGGSRSAVLLQ